MLYCVHAKKDMVFWNCHLTGQCIKQNPAYEYHVMVSEKAHPRFLGYLAALAMKEPITNPFHLPEALLIADEKPKPKPLDDVRKEVKDCLKQKYCISYPFLH